MKKGLEAIEILEKIFGSAAKVKIMRMFLFNKEMAFSFDEIIERTKIKKDVARKEILNLEKSGLLKKKNFTSEKVVGKGKNQKIKKKKVSGWIVDDKFSYIKPLQNFLIHINPLKHNDILKKISSVGKIKLLVISGIFIQELETRVDLLVVGDNLQEQKILSAIKEIESEIGKELRYVIFNTEDFEYRYGMMDKLIRDILDFPHEKVINRIDIA